VVNSESRAITWVWGVLVLITIGTGWLAPAAHTSHLAQASLPITALVLALALIKSRLIIRYFMEVRTAPRWIKVASDAWLVALFGAVIVIYLV
jgi:hypothetical protein